METIQSLLEAPTPDDKLRAYAEFILGLVGPDDESEQPVHDERREHQRYARPIPVSATPVDDDHQPVGPAMQTVARDISAGGTCLLYNEEVRAKRLILELESSSNSTLQVVMEVLRCRKVLDGWYEVAGRFVRW